MPTYMRERVCVQVSVARMLRNAGATYREDFVGPDKLHAIALSVPGPTERFVAIEADGPTSYSRVEPWRETGDCAARRRALQCMGWIVMNVKHAEWRAIAKARDRKVAFRAALERAALDAGEAEAAVARWLENKKMRVIHGRFF